MEFLNGILFIALGYFYTGVLITMFVIIVADIDTVIKNVVPKRYHPEHGIDLNLNMPEVIAIIITWPVWLTITILKLIGRLINYIYRKMRKK